jgi:acyl-CoA synthetase (AMP-forming)/AMP-acid ligase II
MLADILRYWARWQPDAVALRYEGADTTWAELDRRTDALAAGYTEMGVGHGDRIGMLLLNRPELIETCLAAWKLGAMTVPMNVRYTPPEVAYVVADADCKVVIGEEALAEGLRDVSTRQAVVMADDLGSHHRADSAPPTVRISPEDGATICYTSGTTGDPKGAVLTHRGWNATGHAWSASMGFGQHDRLLLPFPLAFTGGFAVWQMAYWSGARLVLERAFLPDRSIELLADEGITGFMAVPAIFQALCDHPRWTEVDLSEWKVACSGGAVVPPVLLSRVQERGIPMLQSYTLTESTASGTVLPSRDATRKLGSAGVPMIHEAVRIAGEDGHVLPAGEIGEIQLRGPNVMARYWNNPAATAEAIVDGGWLRTGDLGRTDDEGYLYVVDRAKDMLISGGLNVYPAEIERVLAGLEGVVEVAVIGVPDQRWGETPAVIAVTSGAVLTGTQVLAACADRLADFKLPRYVVSRAEPLPRNMSGKVLKRELRKEYADLPQTAEPIR